MSQRMKTVVLWLLIIVVFVVFFQIFSAKDTKQSRLDLEAPEYLSHELEAGEVISVQPQGGDLIVTEKDGTRFRVQMQLNRKWWDALSARGVKIESPTEAVSSGFPWMPVLSSILPILLLLVLFIFFLRRMSGGQSFLNLRKTTARQVARPTVTFNDVGGNDEAKQRLRDVVDFLKRPKVWEGVGAKLPSGVLLEGPPGSGKTLLARATAGEAGVPFFEVSASEFVEMFVGVGAARVRDLFEQASKKLPAVIFIDELDAVGRRRGSGTTSYGHQEREQTLNQLLVCLDGFQKRKGLVVIAATNRADVLDEALIRSGRFDIHLKLPPATEQGRVEILKIHSVGKPLAKTVDLNAIARETDGYSGADLQLLVSEAALAAARRLRDANQNVEIEQVDFRTAIAAQAAKHGDFDRVDKLLIDSGAQLVRPSGPAILRATLDDGTVLSGEVLWADERFVKLKKQDGGRVVLSRRNIVSIEALAGTGSASIEDVQPDVWVRAMPDGG